MSLAGSGKDIGAVEGTVMLTTALALTGVEAVSAIWGFHSIGKCRRYSARARRANASPDAGHE